MTTQSNGMHGRAAIAVLDTVFTERAKAALASWLGDQNAAMVWEHKQRYIVILTIDTRNNPRYAHNIECVSDIEVVIQAIKAMTVTVELIGRTFGLSSPSVPHACITDVRLLLDAADATRVDAWLDAQDREFLRSEPSAGAA